MKKIYLYISLILTCGIFCSPSVYGQSQEKIDSLITLFEDAGRNWNIFADQLIEIGEPAVPALLSLLEDRSKEEWTRRIAAMTLNDMHSPSYVEPALRLLLDRSEALVLRNHVSHGLKGRELPNAVDDLWEIYQEEEDVFFKLNIAEILDGNDPHLTSVAYEELYQNSDGFCKQQALKNLVRLHPQESAKWYLSAIQDEDWMTGNLAMDSLKTTRHFIPGRLIRLYHRNETTEQVRWRIIHVLSLRPEMEYLYLLLEALADPGWLVHNEAAIALTRMSPDKVLPELRYLEQSADPQVVGRASWVRNRLDKKPKQELASMQPFDGYPLLSDREEIKELLRNKCVDTISFKKGEIIGDIGAGNGYLEAMLSMFHEDLTFYVQDIDSAVCNPASMNAVVNFYQEVHGQAFTNRFVNVIGTDTDTRLPDRIFDKILMLWTYQYLKYPREFMLDLRENLKEGGLLYVINPDQDYEYGKLLAIEYGWNVSTVDKQISDIIDSGFVLERISRNYEDGELPYIMVFKKK